MFSHRTNWHRQPNRLAKLLDARRASGKPIYDLTVSNPTECGFTYPEQEILSALSHVKALQYHPDPRGSLSARQAVSEYYRAKGIIVAPTNISLTASTSEAYSLMFKLLCNHGDSILVPKPSYPLFEYLAQVNDVHLQHYLLRYDHEWQIDIDSIRNAVTPQTKAIVLVNPHNPTGTFIKKDEYQQIVQITKAHQLALIVDEVFIDYPLCDDETRLGSTACESEVLTFTLNGISKMIGLPQMKLGWVVVSGESLVVSEAVERLEILCDTFLSVNTPVQVALPKLIEHRKITQRQILQRIRSNFSYLQSHISNHQSPYSVLTAEGGWYAIIRVPRTHTDEEWALQVLEQKGVCVHPGYFFDFDEEGYLVVSLLVAEKMFHHAVGELANLF